MRLLLYKLAIGASQDDLNMMAEGLSGERSGLDNGNLVIRYRTACTVFKGRWSLCNLTHNAGVPNDVTGYSDIVVQIGPQIYAVTKEDRERLIEIMRSSDPENIDFNIVLDTQAGERITLDAHGHFENSTYDPPLLDLTGTTSIEFSNYNVLLENPTAPMTGSWTFIPNQNVFLWSDGMYNLFGLPHGEPVAPEIYLERVIDEDRPVAEKLVKCIRGACPFDEQFDIKVDGIIKSLRVIAGPRQVRREIHVIGVDINLTDVNSYHRSERMPTPHESLVRTNNELHNLLRNYRDQLDHDKMKLDNMSQELSSLTFAASHELTEPLRKVRIFAQRILKDEYDNLTTKGRDHFRRILYSVQVMSDLVSAISSYASYKDHMGHVEPIDLSIMLSSLRRFLAPVLEHMGASIEFEVTDGLIGNHEEVKQVIYNLISNAMKFGRRNVPLRICVKGKIVQGRYVAHERADKNKTYYQVEIIDNGIGFDPSYSKYIFDLFRKLHGKLAYPGTGIGLTIVRRIMENHNGFVTVESSPGIGSSFYCYFPV